jgi:hypothetical protein
MKTGDTHRRVLLDQYFQPFPDLDWMNEVFAEYDLSDDTNAFISHGIKKGSDWEFSCTNFLRISV